MTLETTTISAVPDALPLDGTERIILDQNGQTRDAPVSAVVGLVTPDGIGAESEGAAAAALEAHIGSVNPHEQYELKSALGGAAYTNVGTAPGTVAAGDDPRFSGAVRVRCDASAVTTIYIGRASPGTAENAANWAITKTTYTSLGVLQTTLAATGSWTSRQSLNYS